MKALDGFYSPMEIGAAGCAAYVLDSLSGFQTQFSTYLLRGSEQAVGVMM